LERGEGSGGPKVQIWPKALRRICILSYFGTISGNFS
jgi:hypothetical protein